jgi:hypothetical protein
MESMGPLTGASLTTIGTSAPGVSGIPPGPANARTERLGQRSQRHRQWRQSAGDTAANANTG